MVLASTEWINLIWIRKDKKNIKKLTVLVEQWEVTRNKHAYGLYIYLIKIDSTYNYYNKIII